MPTLPFQFLTTGNVTSAWGWFMDSYIGFGMMWMIFGVLIAAVVFGKTKSYGLTGIVFIFYSVIVSTRLPPEIQSYFLLLLVAMAAIMGIKIFWGK